MIQPLLVYFGPKLEGSSYATGAGLMIAKIWSIDLTTVSVIPYLEAYKMSRSVI